MKHVIIAGLVASLLTTGAALAQTIGTVFGPAVSAGEQELEYRLGAASADNGGGSDFAHRLHVQRSLSDTVRWRLIASWTDPGNADLSFDHVQGEWLWQIVEAGPANYASAVRFDARVRDRRDARYEIGLNWTNQWTFAEHWRFRALLLADRDLGSNAANDWIIETRASLSRRFANDLRLSVESFNEFGGLESGFGEFDDQSHQVGPVLGGPLSSNVGWSAGVLFGLSDAAPDHDVVIRLTRAF